MKKYAWTHLNEQFVRELFTLLNAKQIKYFVLRNFEELPERNIGNDVDLVIEPGSYTRVKRIMLDLMRSMEIRFYQIVQFDRMRCWYIMDNCKHFSIHIDFIENEVYKGFEFYDFDILYKNTKDYKFFKVLNNTFDIVMLLVQNLVAYKSLKQKYRDKISENFEENKTQIKNEIISFWGEKCGNFVIENIKKGSFEEIVNNANNLSNEAQKRIFLKKPLKTICFIIRFLVGKFWRIVICPKSYRRFIAVEAPDGTGKTTFIEELIKELGFYYVCDDVRFCVHHFRPEKLPNLGAAREKMGVKKQDKDFTNPHRGRPVGFLSSLLRMTYYWVDYLLFMPIIIRKEVQYGKYTIFDRYIYDFVVDPMRSRINLPKWLRQFFAHLVNKPQLVLVLDASPEIVIARKQELELQEIKRQQIEFRNLKSINKNVVLIDANGSVDNEVEQAIKHIFHTFLEKAY